MSSWVITEADGRKTVFLHLPGLLSGPGNKLYEELMGIPDSEWIQGKFMQYLTPRLVRWHSLDGKTYKFSGKKYESMEYPPELRRFSSSLSDNLKSAIPQETIQGVRLDFDSLNSVLINKYRDHTDSISPHSDNEPEFGREPTIVSVNFGVSRQFILKPMTETQRKKECAKTGVMFVPNSGQNHEKIKLRLDHGDVLIMAGAAQDFWYHEVPKEPEVQTIERLQLIPGRSRLMKTVSTSVRFNLTFRPIK
jgi:alkylated DNA repair dioxygenase AlkB